MDESQRIHKYGNVIILKTDKKQTNVSSVRGTGGVYKVGTTGIKDV